MSYREEAHDEFEAALRRLPPPISCFSDGAACPWCGGMHRTVTFGANKCEECDRRFYFGYPDWHKGKDPVSFVNFPWREFDAVGGKAAALAEWRPNERLQALYFQKSEERIGAFADERKPQ